MSATNDPAAGSSSLQVCSDLAGKLRASQAVAGLPLRPSLPLWLRVPQQEEPQQQQRVSAAR